MMLMSCSIAKAWFIKTPRLRTDDVGRTLSVSSCIRLFSIRCKCLVVAHQMNSVFEELSRSWFNFIQSDASSDASSQYVAKFDNLIWSVNDEHMSVIGIKKWWRTMMIYDIHDLDGEWHEQHGPYDLMNILSDVYIYILRVTNAVYLLTYLLTWSLRNTEPSGLP